MMQIPNLKSKILEARKIAVQVRGFKIEGMRFKVKRLFLWDDNCHFNIDFQCFLLRNDMIHCTIASHETK